MFFIGYKMIKSVLFFKWVSPRYRLNGINFETRIPLLRVVDRKSSQTSTLLTAMEIMVTENMIKQFSVKDIKMICYCLSQEYYQMQKQQLFSAQDNAS